MSLSCLVDALNFNLIRFFDVAIKILKIQKYLVYKLSGFKIIFLQSYT